MAQKITNFTFVIIPVCDKDCGKIYSVIQWKWEFMLFEHILYKQKFRSCLWKFPVFSQWFLRMENKYQIILPSTCLRFFPVPSWYRFILPFRCVVFFFTSFYNNMALGKNQKSCHIISYVCENVCALKHSNFK